MRRLEDKLTLMKDFINTSYDLRCFVCHMLPLMKDFLNTSGSTKFCAHMHTFPYTCMCACIVVHENKNAPSDVMSPLFLRPCCSDYYKTTVGKYKSLKKNTREEMKGRWVG